MHLCRHPHDICSSGDRFSGDPCSASFAADRTFESRASLVKPHSFTNRRRLRTSSWFRKYRGGSTYITISIQEKRIEKAEAFLEQLRTGRRGLSNSERLFFDILQLDSRRAIPIGLEATFYRKGRTTDECPELLSVRRSVPLEQPRQVHVTRCP